MVAERGGNNKEGDEFNAGMLYTILARRLGGLTLGVSSLRLASGTSASGPLRYDAQTYRHASAAPLACRMFVTHARPPAISWRPEIVLS